MAKKTLQKQCYFNLSGLMRPYHIVAKTPHQQQQAVAIANHQ